MKNRLPAIMAASLLSASLVWGGSTGKAAKWEAGKYFSGRCSGCHGKDGRGNPRAAAKLKADLPAMDLQGEEARGRTDADLSGIILKGSGKMPAFGKFLNAKQAGDMVVYIRGLGRAVQEKKAVNGGAIDGAALFSAKGCANCHGMDGKGVAKVAQMMKADAGAMDLTGGEARGKTAGELAGIISGGADGGKMPAYGGKLGREEIMAIVAHIRGFK